MELTKCVECGGRLEAGAHTHTVDVGGRSFRVQVPARRCTACGETFITYEALEGAELAIARELATTGASGGDALKFMRKALGMKATDLAALLGVAAERVSRWENDARPADRTAVATLGAMVLDRLEGRTTTTDRLRALAEPPRLAKVVRLDVPRARARG